MYLVSLFLKVDKIRTNVRKSAIDRSIAGLYISNSTTRHQRRESKGNVYRQKSSAKRNLIHLRNIECWLARSRIWKQASRQASKQINEWFWFEYHVFLVGARNWLDPRRLSPRGIIYEYKERKIKMKNFLPLAGCLPACLPARWEHKKWSFYYLFSKRIALALTDCQLLPLSTTTLLLYSSDNSTCFSTVCVPYILRMVWYLGIKCDYWLLYFEHLEWFFHTRKIETDPKYLGRK